MPCGKGSNLVEYEYIGEMSPIYTVVDMIQPIMTSQNQVIINKGQPEHTPGQNSEYSDLTDLYWLVQLEFLFKLLSET